MKKLFVFFFALFLLAACGNQNHEQSEQEVFPLEVNLQVPATANPNEEVTLSAEVMYGEEKVQDANEVKFEIWKQSAKESSEMIEAKHKGDGIYEITYSFPEDGVYFVQSHVTAKNQHNMPKKQIVIGNGEK